MFLFSDFADYYYSVDVQFPLYPDLSLVPLLPLTSWTLFKPNVHITPALQHSTNIIILPPLTDWSLQGLLTCCNAWCPDDNNPVHVQCGQYLQISSIGQPDCDLIIMDMSCPDYCGLACSYSDLVWSAWCSHYELSQ